MVESAIAPPAITIHAPTANSQVRSLNMASPHGQTKRIPTPAAESVKRLAIALRPSAIVPPGLRVDRQQKPALQEPGEITTRRALQLQPGCALLPSRRAQSSERPSTQVELLQQRARELAPPRNGIEGFVDLREGAMLFEGSIGKLVEDDDGRHEDEAQSLPRNQP